MKIEARTSLRLVATIIQEDDGFGIQLPGLRGYLSVFPTLRGAKGSIVRDLRQSGVKHDVKFKAVA